MKPAFHKLHTGVYFKGQLVGVEPNPGPNQARGKNHKVNDIENNEDDDEPPSTNHNKNLDSNHLVGIE